MEEFSIWSFDDDKDFSSSTLRRLSETKQGLMLLVAVVVVGFDVACTSSPSGSWGISP